MNPEIQHLIILLNVGEQNATKANELNHLLGFEPSNTSPETRNLIRDAIIDHRIPIGSCGHGYYMIETEDEFNRVVAEWKSHIRGIQRRIDGVKQGWEEKTGVKIQKRQPRAKGFF